MGERNKYEVAVDGITSYLTASNLREAVEKAFKLIPRDWPGRPTTFKSVVIQEVEAPVDV